MKKHSKRSKEELQEDRVMAQIQGHLQEYPLQALCNIMFAWVKNTITSLESKSEVKTTQDPPCHLVSLTQRELVNRLGADVVRDMVAEMFAHEGSFFRTSNTAELHKMLAQKVDALRDPEPGRAILVPFRLTTKEDLKWAMAPYRKEDRNKWAKLYRQMDKVLRRKLGNLRRMETRLKKEEDGTFTPNEDPTDLESPT